MIRKSKRCKNRIDHISNLPDCILHHILSFIPTKEVVKTSILSPRWKNLWASAPNIDFDDTLLCDNFPTFDFDIYSFCVRKVDDTNWPTVTSFLNFIKRVLTLRGESNIKKFDLTCFGSFEESEIPTSQIHSWISDAIMHNVQELKLSLFREDPSMIPWPMFDGTSLVTLKIRTNQATELPSCISFPCLKTLHLETAVFPNDDHLQKLLLGCLVLEELVLSDIWMNLKNIVISNSTLKSLTINDLSAFKPSYDATSGCKIKIESPNVRYFEYIGFLPNEIFFSNASSIVKVCIYIPPEWQIEVTSRVIGLLKRLQNVVSLKLSMLGMKAIKLVKDGLHKI